MPRAILNQKGAELHPRNFRPISIVAKRLDRCIARGMEVGLGPGHIVLDGDPATLPKKVRAPNFRPISIVAKWLDGLRLHLAWRWASVQATLC